MSLEALVSQARQGDTSAFEQLMIDNEKKIYNLCLRMCRNPEDASDLTQEAFLKAWRSLDSFHGESSFSTWIYRLASNVCLDFLRREKRRQVLSSGPSFDDEDAQAKGLHLTDQRHVPHLQLEQKELRQEIDQGLEQLSPEHRQILVMREINGLSYGEICQVLGIESGTVKSRLARARLALRTFLLERGNLPPPTSSKASEKAIQKSVREG